MKRVLSILSFLFLILLTIPAAQAQEALTQTFTAPDGSYSLMYPVDWTATLGVDGASIQLASADQSVYGNILYKPNPEPARQIVVETAEADLVKESAITVTEFEVNGSSAARSQFEDPNYTNEVIVVKYTNGKALIISVLESSPDAIANGGATLVAIANSFTAVDAAGATTTSSAGAPGTSLTQTYTIADNSFSIRYPAGWKADDTYSNGGFTQFSSGPSIVMNQAMELLKSGDMGVALFPVPNAFLEQEGISGATIHDYISSMSINLGASNPKTEDLTVGSYTAARVVMNAFDKDEEIIGVDFGNGKKVAALGITFKGELTALDTTMQAMMASIQAPADSGSASPSATEAAGSATAEATEPSAEVTAVATEALPPLFTSTANANIVSARIPDNWEARSYPSGDNAQIALLEEQPNHLGGEIDFPPIRNGNSPHEIATFPTNYVKGTVTDIEINGRPAARLDGTSNGDTVLYIAVTTSKGDFVLVNFGGPADAMAQEETTLLAIAASITTGDPNAIDTTTPVPAATAAAPPTTTAASNTSTSSTCTVTASKGANLRSGPSTTFARAGALTAGVSQSVIGQANGSDGFIWWKLDSGSWVRSDLVQTSGDCTAVPTVAS